MLFLSLRPTLFLVQYASMKRAQTLLSAELQNKVHKTDEQVKSKLAPAERDNRIKEQCTRLEGLWFKGEEECSHQSYDLVLNMMERDSLVYLAPEKFAIRRSELAMKKSAKEIAIDQTSLVVKDKRFNLCNYNRARHNECNEKESPRLRPCEGM